MKLRLITESSSTSISDHTQYQPKTDMEINFFNAEGQGFHCILEALFKIVKEYFNLYLNCEQVLHTQTYTVCTTIQLLKVMYQVMDTEERPKWTQIFVSATTLEVCILSISKYREGKLDFYWTVLNWVADHQNTTSNLAQRLSCMIII